MDLLIWFLLNDPKGLLVLLAILVTYFTVVGVVMHLTGRL